MHRTEMTTFHHKMWYTAKNKEQNTQKEQRAVSSDVYKQGLQTVLHSHTSFFCSEFWDSASCTLG